MDINSRNYTKYKNRTKIILSDDLEQEIINGNAVRCAECGWIGPRIQWTHLKYKCSSKVLTLDDYKKKHPDQLIVAPNAAKLLGCTKEKLINLYGETRGSELWAEYRNKQAESNSFKYKAKKHGWTEDKFKKFNESREVTIENLIKKHGEEAGTAKWQKYCERQKYTCTLEYFKDTYGNDEGSRKYFNFVKQRSFANTNISKIESAVFNECAKLIPELQQQVSIGHLFYRPYDFGNIFQKKLVEFYGSYWHCDPRLYSETHVMRQKGATAKQIRSRDQAKRTLAINQGFKIFVIWEMDWCADQAEVLNNLTRWWNEN